MREKAEFVPQLLGVLGGSPAALNADAALAASARRCVWLSCETIDQALICGGCGGLRGL